MTLSNILSYLCTRVTHDLTSDDVSKDVRYEFEMILTMIEHCQRLSGKRDREITELQERVDWLGMQREIEVRQKEAALNESGECLKQLDQARAQGYQQCLTEEDNNQAFAYLFGGVKEEDMSPRTLKIATKMREAYDKGRSDSQACGATTTEK